MTAITVNLDPAAPQPLYEQLYEFIKREIVSYRCAPGVRLPAQRELAAYLRCSRNTVQAAYGQLAAEGYIEPRQRSGYYVRHIEGLLRLDKPTAAAEEHVAPGPVCRYDFSLSGVDRDSFPFAAWRRLYWQVLGAEDVDLLRTGHPQGDPRLRAAIAAYLHGSRGVNCTPEQIVVSSGTEFLLNLLIQLLPEECIFAIENPGYEKLNMLFKSSRAAYRCIPLDESGLRADRLGESDAAVACVTPSHQFPTGSIMPVSRRVQLLNWAAARPERYIVEDDYDSEFKYAGRPISSLQGMDSGGKVIYLGAFSKSLTPAVRISFMVLPERLLQVYQEQLSFYLCPVAAAEQKTLARFINEGYFERHLNRMRKIYRGKREVLAATIRRLLPQAEIAGANAGLHLTLTPHNNMSEDELAAAAAAKGVKVYGMSAYYFDQSPELAPPRLLLGFAALPAGEIPVAVELLRQAWF